MKLRKVKPQWQLLIEHFDNEESISNMEAQAVYKMRALPKRISELKERGYVFRHEWKRDLTGQRYMRYFILEKGE